MAAVSMAVAVAMALSVAVVGWWGVIDFAAVAVVVRGRGGCESRSAAGGGGGDDGGGEMVWRRLSKLGPGLYPD